MSNRAAAFRRSGRKPQRLGALARGVQRAAKRSLLTRWPGPKSEKQKKIEANPPTRRSQ